MKIVATFATFGAKSNGNKNRIILSNKLGKHKINQNLHIGCKIKESPTGFMIRRLKQRVLAITRHAILSLLMAKKKPIGSGAETLTRGRGKDKGIAMVPALKTVFSAHDDGIAMFL